MDGHARRMEREGQLTPEGRWLLALRAGNPSWSLAMAEGYPLHGCKPYPVGDLRPVSWNPDSDEWYAPFDCFRRWGKISPARKANPGLSPSARKYKRDKRREERTRRESSLTREAQRAERMGKLRQG